MQKLEVTEVRFHLIRSTLGYQRRLATPHHDGTCLRALCVLAEVFSLERIRDVKLESCGNFQGTIGPTPNSVAMVFIVFSRDSLGL